MLRNDSKRMMDEHGVGYLKPSSDRLSRRFWPLHLTNLTFQRGATNWRFEITIFSVVVVDLDYICKVLDSVITITTKKPVKDFADGVFQSSNMKFQSMEGNLNELHIGMDFLKHWPLQLIYIYTKDSFDGRIW